ncbi:MAG: hypothetical protein CMJ31_00535 [Phycisphaerae bacterium]|nr:hypothetical protein [Phycisphaerae bacterium]
MLSLGSRSGRALWATPFSTKLVVALTLSLAFMGFAMSCQTGGPTIENAPRYAGEPDIRVRVESAADRATIQGSGSLELALVRGSRVTQTINIDGPVVITPSDDGMQARAGADTFTAPFGAHFEARATSGLTIDRTAMPGVVEVRRRGDAIDVIVIAPMERYLEGVLAGELISGWPLAAFEAQAVAARTYAMHERRRARDSGRAYDVESTTLDQVFVGETYATQPRLAVQATRGVVLTEHSKLIRSYYSSTCGGRPSSAAAIWPTSGEFFFNTAGPIQAHPRDCPCERSPLHRWSRTRSVADVTSRVTTWGKSAGHGVRAAKSVRSIEAVDWNDAGRPNAYTITDEGGSTFRVSAEELRVALNTSTTGHPNITRDTRMPSGDFQAFNRGASIEFRGRGFGHGVGLCQWGAFGQASAGKDWQAIVLHYYPGARLERWWSRSDLAAR